MAKDHGSSVKDDKTYEALRDDGASKKAARIANAKAGGGKPPKQGGKSSRYEDQIREQLQRKAAGPLDDGQGPAHRRPAQPLRISPRL